MTCTRSLCYCRTKHIAGSPMWGNKTGSVHVFKCSQTPRSQDYLSIRPNFCEDLRYKRKNYLKKNNLFFFFWGGGSDKNTWELYILAKSSHFQGKDRHGSAYGAATQIQSGKALLHLMRGSLGQKLWSALSALQRATLIRWWSPQIVLMPRWARASSQ